MRHKAGGQGWAGVGGGGPHTDMKSGMTDSSLLAFKVDGERMVNSVN